MASAGLADPPPYPAPPIYAPPAAYAAGYNPAAAYYPPAPYAVGYNPAAAYYPPPGYYGPVYVAPVPNPSTTAIAGALWAGCLVRDILILLAIMVYGTIAGYGGGGFESVFFVVAIFPVLGAVGSFVAMLSDFDRSNHAVGSAGGVVAIIGSSFPGIIVIGPIGLAMGIVGLVLHTQARPLFRS